MLDKIYSMDKEEAVKQGYLKKDDSGRYMPTDKYFLEEAKTNQISANVQQDGKKKTVSQKVEQVIEKETAPHLWLIGPEKDFADDVNGPMAVDGTVIVQIRDRGDNRQDGWPIVIKVDINIKHAELKYHLQNFLNQLDDFSDNLVCH